MIAQNFWNSSGVWANNVFGPPSKRGPLGPILHLKKEIEELHKAFLEYSKTGDSQEEIIKARKKFRTELADCQHLIFDIARRDLMTYHEFFDLCFQKLDENKARKWPPTSSNEPVEHIKEEE